MTEHTSAEREALVQFSAKITARQGRWLDGKAIRSGRSTGELLREVLDEAMAREE